jgi:hypothetical protein
MEHWESPQSLFSPRRMWCYHYAVGKMALTGVKVLGRRAGWPSGSPIFVIGSIAGVYKKISA